ncbi:DUF2283 domain-containing protein [Streptomyces sp. NPDC000658]|uniref:DUF2283 domain-containing protein n=1 Tax=Streptomyces sp. NPDC000658 TaxID=3154266 RepID=UPI0033299C8E
MADVRVAYDRTADAAYVHLVHAQTRARSAHMHPCDPVRADGMINLDLDEEGRLIGIEAPTADSKLPGYLLVSAERLDPDGA